MLELVNLSKYLAASPCWLNQYVNSQVQEPFNGVT